MNEVTFTLLLIGGMYAAFLTADYARIRAEHKKAREVIDRLTHCLRCARQEIAELEGHLSPADRLLAYVMEADHVR